MLPLCTRERATLPARHRELGARLLFESASAYTDGATTEQELREALAPFKTNLFFALQTFTESSAATEACEAFCELLATLRDEEVPGPGVALHAAWAVAFAAEQPALAARRGVAAPEARAGGACPAPNG